MCRIQVDQTEVYKIVKGIDNVDQCSFFNPPVKQGVKVIWFFLLPSSRLNARKFSFSHRVLSKLNSLLPKAVNDTTVNVSKNTINSIFRKKRRHRISQNPLSVPGLKTRDVNSVKLQ